MQAADLAWTAGGAVRASTCGQHEGVAANQRAGRFEGGAQVQCRGIWQRWLPASMQFLQVRARAASLA